MTASTSSPREVAAELVDRVLDVPAPGAASVATEWLRAVLGADRVEVHLLDRRRERLHLAAAAVRDESQAPAEPHLDVGEGPAAQVLHAEEVFSHRSGDRGLRYIPLEAYGHTPACSPSWVRPRRAGRQRRSGSRTGDAWAAPCAVLLNQAATTTDQLELVRRTYLGTGGGRRDVGPGELPEYARTAGAVTAAAGRVLSAVLPPAPRAAAPPAVGDA